MPLNYLEYRFTLENFFKMVKAQKKFEWKLNVWAKEFKPLVDRAVEEPLKAYKK